MYPGLAAQGLLVGCGRFGGGGYFQDWSAGCARAKGLEVGMSDPFRDEVVALIPPLRGYAIALTRSSVEADDLVQDALVRAWQFRAGFKVGTNLKAWLYKILRNTFYTQSEKRRR